MDEFFRFSRLRVLTHSLFFVKSIAAFSNTKHTYSGSKPQF